MTIWIPDLSRRKGARCRALASAIIDDIRSGILPAGARLPPQRYLADKLGLSPNTVMRAYMDVTRRGYIEGIVGRGTFVVSPDNQRNTEQAGAVLRPDTGPIDFSVNLPFMENNGNILEGTLAGIIRENNSHMLLDHYPDAMRLRHQEAGAQWLCRHGLNCSADTVMITSGAQQAIFIALMTLLKPDDVLLTESLSYSPVKEMAQKAGRRVVGITMDDEGISPEHLRAACRHYRPRALYLMPTLHTPTAITMGEDRRREIALIAREFDFYLIEDDVFGMLPASRPAPVAVYAPLQTVFITSLSKSVAPGLRVGFMHAPDKILRALAYTSQLICRHQPAMMAEIASRWIQEGRAEEMNAMQRDHARRRQTLAASCLGNTSFHASPEGHHIWLFPGGNWDADTFATAAGVAGVLVNPASIFSMNQAKLPAAVRVCLSHERSDQRVSDGLNRLAALIRQESTLGPLVY